MAKKKKFKGESKLKGCNSTMAERYYEKASDPKAEVIKLDLKSPPSADFDSDTFQGVFHNPRLVPGISTHLTKAQIESLHKGLFVSSGDFTKALESSKNDPIFYAVRGEPTGTVIANSQCSILLPNCHIKLGSKFDYRY